MTATRKARVPFSESGIVALLAKRYASPAWVLMPQARNGTGYARRATTADAVAMSTWPSRGLELLGFEIKVSRNDWLRELDDPGKAEPIMKFCDRWWLVVGDADIVKPGELPKTWGLMHVRGGRLMVHTEAPPLKAEPVDRLFLAALLRNVSDGFVPRATMETMANELAEERVQRATDLAARDLRNAEQQHERLRTAVARFEAESGVSINTWAHGNVAAAVRRVTEGFGGGPVLLRHLARVAEVARQLADRAETHRREFAAEIAPAIHADGPCCPRADEYNGFASGGLLFTCPKHCGCHD